MSNITFRLKLNWALGIVEQLTYLVGGLKKFAEYFIGCKNYYFSLKINSKMVPMEAFFLLVERIILVVFQMLKSPNQEFKSIMGPSSYKLYLQANIMLFFAPLKSSTQLSWAISTSTLSLQGILTQGSIYMYPCLYFKCTFLLLDRELLNLSCLCVPFLCHTP